MNRPVAYKTCPFCHAPVAAERYELAVVAGETFRVCPECDSAIAWTVASGRAEAP